MEDGKWHWRFTTQEGGNAYGSHVTAYLDGDESVWEMRITASNLGLDEFLWYDGRARLDGASGHWTFHEPAGASATSRIDWTHPEADAWTARFSDTNPASQNQGNWLLYDVIGSNRSVSYYDASAGTTLEIAWDAVARAGWIIAPGYNGGQMACWDGALNDTSCS